MAGKLIPGAPFFTWLEDGRRRIARQGGDIEDFANGAVDMQPTCYRAASTAPMPRWGTGRNQDGGLARTLTRDLLALVATMGADRSWHG